MSYYSVLEVTPTVEDWIPPYLEAVGLIVVRHGGRYLARTASHERLEGEGAEVALRIILEWPTGEAAKAFMNDPDYAPWLKARTEGSVSHHVLVEGKDDLS